MSSCSKAARGLFVLMRTDGIFTANALSPSPTLRQYPYHYSIRAGQNLPDKEFRYLRTVIVTAAVHWGFSSHREALPLTFQHRAGVTPYTSTFVLAESCVFGKQLHGFFRCGPATLFITKRCAICGVSFLFSVFSQSLVNKKLKNLFTKGFTLFQENWRIHAHTVINTVAGQTLSRSYGRCIAEFLSVGSLVRRWSTRPEHLCWFAVRVA